MKTSFLSIIALVYPYLTIKLKFTNNQVEMKENEIELMNKSRNILWLVILKDF